MPVSYTLKQKQRGEGNYHLTTYFTTDPRGFKYNFIQSEHIHITISVKCIKRNYIT